MADTKKKKSDKLFDCATCGKQFTKASLLKAHLETHSAPRFACTQCNYVGKTSKYLKRHIECTHLKNKLLVPCDLCNRKFRFKGIMEMHRLVHTGEKPYKCNSCDKAFNTPYSLSTHKLIHTGEKPFQCSFCEYACRDGSSLRRHQNKHMGIEKVYECTPCQKPFKRYSDLKLHVAETHLNISVRTLECHHCGKAFKTKGVLSQHIKQVHMRTCVATCALCNKRCSSAHNLTMHLRTHADQKPFVCPEEGCGYGARESGDLKKHMAIHDDARPFQCDVCGKTFRRKSHLRVHAATHEERARQTVQCHYCGDKFSSKLHLGRHLAKHESVTSSARYCCTRCGFRAKSERGLRLHQQAHSKHKSPTTFKCTRCAAVYKFAKSLRSHYVKMHDLVQEQNKFPTTYNCHLCDAVYKHAKSLRSHCAKRHDFVPERNASANLKQSKKPVVKKEKMNTIKDTLIEKSEIEDVKEDVEEDKIEIETEEEKIEIDIEEMNAARDRGENEMDDAKEDVSGKEEIRVMNNEETSKCNEDSLQNVQETVHPDTVITFNKSGERKTYRARKRIRQHWGVPIDRLMEKDISEIDCLSLARNKGRDDLVTERDNLHEYSDQDEDRNSLDGRLTKEGIDLYEQTDSLNNEEGLAGEEDNLDDKQDVLDDEGDNLDIKEDDLDNEDNNLDKEDVLDNENDNLDDNEEVLNDEEESYEEVENIFIKIEMMDEAQNMNNNTKMNINKNTNIKTNIETKRFRLRTMLRVFLANRKLLHELCGGSIGDTIMEIEKPTEDEDKCGGSIDNLEDDEMCVGGIGALERIVRDVEITNSDVQRDVKVVELCDGSIGDMIMEEENLEEEVCVGSIGRVEQIESEIKKGVGGDMLVDLEVEKVTEKNEVYDSGNGYTMMDLEEGNPMEKDEDVIMNLEVENTKEKDELCGGGNGDIKQTNVDMQNVDEELKITDSNVQRDVDEVKLCGGSVRDTTMEEEKQEEENYGGSNGIAMMEVKMDEEDLSVSSNGDVKINNAEKEEEEKLMEKYKDDVVVNVEVEKPKEENETGKEEIYIIGRNEDVNMNKEVKQPKEENKMCSDSNGEIKQTSSEFQKSFREIKIANSELQKTDEEVKPCGGKIGDKKMNLEVEKSKEKDKICAGVNGDIEQTNSEVQRNVEVVELCVSNIVDVMTDLEVEKPKEEDEICNGTVENVIMMNTDIEKPMPENEICDVKRKNSEIQRIVEEVLLVDVEVEIPKEEDVCSGSIVGVNGSNSKVQKDVGEVKLIGDEGHKAKESELDGRPKNLDMPKKENDELGSNNALIMNLEKEKPDTVIEVVQNLEVQNSIEKDLMCNSSARNNKKPKGVKKSIEDVIIAVKKIREVLGQQQNDKDIKTLKSKSVENDSGQENADSEKTSIKKRNCTQEVRKKLKNKNIVDDIENYDKTYQSKKPSIKASSQNIAAEDETVNKINCKFSNLENDTNNNNTKTFKSKSESSKDNAAIMKVDSVKHRECGNLKNDANKILKSNTALKVNTKKNAAIMEINDVENTDCRNMEDDANKRLKSRSGIKEVSENNADGIENMECSNSEHVPSKRLRKSGLDSSQDCKVKKPNRGRKSLKITQKECESERKIYLTRTRVNKENIFSRNYKIGKDDKENKYLHKALETNKNIKHSKKTNRRYKKVENGDMLQLEMRSVMEIDIPFDFYENADAKLIDKVEECSVIDRSSEMIADESYKKNDSSIDLFRFGILADKNVLLSSAVVDIESEELKSVEKIKESDSLMETGLEIVKAMSIVDLQQNSPEVVELNSQHCTTLNEVVKDLDDEAFVEESGYAAANNTANNDQTKKTRYNTDLFQRCKDQISLVQSELEVIGQKPGNNKNVEISKKDAKSKDSDKTMNMYQKDSSTNNQNMKVNGNAELAKNNSKQISIPVNKNRVYKIYKTKNNQNTELNKCNENSCVQSEHEVKIQSELIDEKGDFKNANIKDIPNSVFEKFCTPRVYITDKRNKETHPYLNRLKEMEVHQSIQRMLEEARRKTRDAMEGTGHHDEKGTNQGTNNTIS